MTDDDRSQGSTLSEAFPPEQLKRHPSKGLTYIPIPEVVARLNRVLGSGNWNSEIVRLWDAGTVPTETGEYPKWVMAHVRLSGVVDEVKFCYEGVGGQEVQFTGKPNFRGPVDIGDSYKGAVSDATKKAAQSLGVGLELAREDDAMHYEQAAREADQPKAAPEILAKIKAMALELNEKDRAQFNKVWAGITGDGTRGKKLDAGQVTVKEAAETLAFLEGFKNALITEQAKTQEPTQA